MPKKDRALVKGQHGISESLGMKRHIHRRHLSSMRLSPEGLAVAAWPGVLAQAGYKA